MRFRTTALSVFTSVSRVVRTAANSWNRLQIGHRERYSVERMLALRDYYENSSPLRVLLVCLVTPLSAFAAVTLIECIPLRPPAEGWRANVAFWIRLFLSSFPMAVGGVLQVKQVTPPGVISCRATVAIGLGTALGYVACAVALAALWTFPVPFGYALMVGPFVFFFMASFGVVIGPRTLLVTSLRQQIIPPLSVLAAQGVLAGCYPPFYAVFHQLSGVQQTAFVAVLPLIKALSKQYIAKVSVHLQEHIGPTIIFSVDVCNVLYSVICMQTAVSSLTSILMVGSDVLFIVLVLRSIYQMNSASVWPETALLSSIRTRRRNYLQFLPELVRQAFQSADSRDDPSHPIRVCAPFPLRLAAGSKELMAELCCVSTGLAPVFAGSPAPSLRRVSSLPDIRSHCFVGDSRAATVPEPASEVKATQRLNRGGLKTKSSSRVHPLKLKVASRSVSIIAISSKKLALSTSVRPVQTKTAGQEVQDALQALFHSEYVLMAEYVECVLPMLYAVYLTALRHLPTAAYYPHMHSLNGDKFSATLRNLLLYALVEFASFVGVSLLLKRKFGFSPLYQLAFVLETQARALQSQLLIWVLCILQFTLVHNASRMRPNQGASHHRDKVDSQYRQNSLCNTCYDPTLQLEEMALDARVHPVVPVNPPRILVTLGVFERVFRAVRGYWNNIQVGHRGRYSVERLLAFQEYYQRTSPGRAFMVCFLALLPPFVVAILVELIPLKPPDLGWKANYCFWIRLYATALPIAFGGLYQVKEVVEPGAVSTVGSVIIIVGTSTCYVTLTMLVAALWTFPIPFGFVLSIAPFIGIYMILLTLNIGPRVLARSPTLRRQLSAQLLVIAAEGILGIAYPTFGAIFNQLSSMGQTAFIFVLPIIKFSIKQFVAKMSAHLHEYVGLTVLLSVDVCNVLYVAICVQTAVSPITSGLLIASDAFFVLMALRSIYYQSDVSQARQRLLSMNSKLPATLNYIRNLRALLREAFQSPPAAEVPIRIRAPFPLPLSDESKAFMEDLELVRRRYSVETELAKDMSDDLKMTKSCPRARSASGSWHNHEKRESSRTTSPTRARSVHNSQEYLQLPSTPPRIDTDYSFDKPALAHKVSAKTTVPGSLPRSTASGATRTTSRAESYHHEVVVADVQDSLQALFHSEYVMLAEFIECVIPMLYGVYLAVLYHLPTAAYYPHTRTLTPEKLASTELNIMLYAAVEFSSFIGVNLLLQRKFGFSPLYQLAFVCETHARAIQSHLIVWILYVLTLSLVHNGVDLEAPFK